MHDEQETQAHRSSARGEHDDYALRVLGSIAQRIPPRRMSQADLVDQLEGLADVLDSYGDAGNASITREAARRLRGGHQETSGACL